MSAAPALPIGASEINCTRRHEDSCASARECAVFCTEIVPFEPSHTLEFAAWARQNAREADLHYDPQPVARILDEAGDVWDVKEKR